MQIECDTFSRLDLTSLSSYTDLLDQLTRKNKHFYSFQTFEFSEIVFLP